MDVLVIVTTRSAGSVLIPLGEALGRRRVCWGAFFTNDGVETLQDEKVVGALASGERAVVCQESWNLHLPGVECPVELGSQTNNSALVAAAERIVSL